MKFKVLFLHKISPFFDKKRRRVICTPNTIETNLNTVDITPKNPEKNGNYTGSRSNLRNVMK